jgi:alcohol dehydrogenase (cytochrome c)
MKLRALHMVLGLTSAMAAILPGCRSAEDRAEQVATPVATRIEPVFVTVGDSILRRSDDAAVEAWAVYGGAYNNQRYSALDQVNVQNVAGLVPAWVHQTGIAESFQTTPIVVGNVMYITTAESRVVALNAVTGHELWRFTPHIERFALCCGPNNRGVAVLGNHVFVATIDGNLMALDNRTGELVWETRVGDPAEGYSITMAPLAFGDRVVVGVSGGKYGIRGFVAAYEAGSGNEVWRFYTIPAPDEAPNGWWGEWLEIDPFGTALDRNIARERADSARYQDGWRRGGGAVWMTPAYDPASNTLFFSVGNPSPPLDGIIRPGDNLYTGSIVAVDGATGEYKWHFQYLPHDVWDLSPGSPPFIFNVNGRRLVGHAGKTGWLYVVDAASGQPVLRSDNFVPQANLFTRPSEEGTAMAPGANGGTSWSPVAFSPRTSLAYVLATHQPMVYTRSYQPREPGRLWLGGSFTINPHEQQYGTISAINVQTGEIQWQQRTRLPAVGASLVTAGDLLFVGQSTGTFDAYDASNGTLLWSFNTGAGVNGGAVTYSVDGIQYIAVAAGGNYHLDTPRGNTLIAFRLFNQHATAPLHTLDAPQYTRGGPIRHGEVRQVPAAELAPRPRDTIPQTPVP